jgi:hypothetical protein
VLAVRACPARGQALQHQVKALGETLLVAVQSGAEHLQVHPRSTAPDSQPKPAAGQVRQQRRLLGQRDRMRRGQDADRRADHDPASQAQGVPGEGHRRGTHPVRHEVVLGDPHVVEPGGLRAHHRVHRPPQRLAVILTRKPARHQEHACPHPYLSLASVRSMRYRSRN